MPADKGFIDHIVAAADDLTSAAGHVVAAEAYLAKAAAATTVVLEPLEAASQIFGLAGPGTVGANIAAHLDAAAGSAASGVASILADGQAHADAAHVALFGSSSPPPP